jgi:hypothetical protein
MRRSLGVGAVFAAATLFIFMVAVPAPATAYETLAELEGATRAVVAVRAVEIALDPTGLVEADRAMLAVELQAAAGTWTAVDCSSVDVAYAATVGGAFTVRLVGDWVARGLDPQVPATTELALLQRPDGTIEITGATILLDSAQTWSPHPSQDGSGGLDVRSVLVHEIGHVLGLAHEPSEPDATMFPTYQGWTQASLAEDDIAGICALYPGGRAYLVGGGPSEVDGCRTMMSACSVSGASTPSVPATSGTEIPACAGPSASGRSALRSPWAVRALSFASSIPSVRAGRAALPSRTIAVGSVRLCRRHPAR